MTTPQAAHVAVLEALLSEFMRHDADETCPAIQALTAAIDLMKQSGWQPIETAPKDGTNVLIYSPDRCGNCPEGSTGIGNARWLYGEWITGRLRSTGQYTRPSHAPTHWQPLPAAPTEESR